MLEEEFNRGPNGPDTNFLVRATSHEKAVLLANDLLSKYTNGGVREYCESISLIGTDKDHTEEAVFHEPFISHAFFINKSKYKTWSLVSNDTNKWEEIEQQ